MTDEDANAFRKAMAGVKPLAAATPPAATPKPRAVARFAGAGQPAELWEARRLPLDARARDTDDVIAFKRPGVRDDALRRLRRGQVPVEGEIDLHGLSRHATHEALRTFIGMALAQRLQCVRVIHGKGLRSGPGGPVLKHFVSDWLGRIESVAAFATARPADGGTGALYVLLKLPGLPRDLR
jgi:DNA-nicking Smr family endonuclease